MAVQETRQKSIFSSRKFRLYQHALAALEHASILSPSNSLAAWERKRIRFNGNISTVRFISTTDHRIARATLERARARASSYERAAELETFVSVFVFVLPSPYTKLKNNTVLQLQYCSYYLPLKNSSTIHDLNLHQQNSSTVPHDSNLQ